MSAARPPLKLFISYAHADEAEERELLVHLKALVPKYYTLWEDRQIDPGQEWNAEIQQRLAEADVVLFLVSASLIASDYVRDKELPQALRQWEAGRSDIVPAILKACDWEDPAFAFSRFQGILNERRPIVLGERDSGYNEIVQGLKKVYHRRTGPAEAKAPADSQALQPPPPPPRWKHLTAALALIATIGGGGYLYIDHRDEAARSAQGKAELSLGWRLLRIGDYAGASARLARAPGLDPLGGEAASLGAMLATLGDEAQRRQFIPRLEAFEQAAPSGSPAQAFALYLRAVETFERGARQQAQEIWFLETSQLLGRSVGTDPKLADAHALLAALLSLNCQHDAAFAAIDAALLAGGELAPPRYLVQRAHLLLRRAAPGDADQARALYQAQGAEAEAQLALALMDWDAGRWADARAALAGATAQLERQADRPEWLLLLPEGPLRLGQATSKRCLLAYASAAGDALAGPAPDLARAWRAVPDCARLEPEARSLVCAHLPDGAAAARQALACPTPQPRAHCPAPSSPLPQT